MSSVMPISQFITIPAGLTTNVRSIAVSSGALTRIATGTPNIAEVSYDDLDKVPRIAGPLLDLDVGRRGHLLTREEFMGDDLYDGLKESGFDKQRAFLQNLAGRRLPKFYQLNHLIKVDEGEGALDKENISLRYATVEFLKFLVIQSASDAIEQLGSYLEDDARRRDADAFLAMRDLPSDLEGDANLFRGNAYSSFEENELYGAAAILEDFASRNEKRKHLDNARAFLHVLESEKDGTTLGAAYLYGLYSAKNAYVYALHGATNKEDVKKWGVMQRLFMHAGGIHEKKEAYDAAARAYLASVWAFAQQESAPSDDLELAISALDLAERTMQLFPQVAQVGEMRGAVRAVAQQLRKL